ncbi:Bardet-Biedl syndrome 5 protein [Chytridiales sp. JEL 0842]|nr:Bardet-Biedl syndrome 5 protein [Chytridiales sp. JEL 0842]
MNAFTPTSDSGLWQDREIRFDSPPKLLEPTKSETLHPLSLSSVSDSKSNPPTIGTLYLTSLRLLFISSKSNRVNLSIGLNCLTPLIPFPEPRVVDSPSENEGGGGLKGVWNLTASYSRVKFEFVFEFPWMENTLEVINSWRSVVEMYASTKWYREVRMRAGMVEKIEGEGGEEEGWMLKMLEGERVIKETPGVMNLTSSHGTLGTLTLTSHRTSWHAHLDPQTLNVSIPHAQMVKVYVQSGTKYGTALVIEIEPRVGGFKLGFQIDGNAEIKNWEAAVKAAHKSFWSNPDFGVGHSALARTSSSSTSVSRDSLNMRASQSILNLSQQKQEPKEEDLAPMDSTPSELAFELADRILHHLNYTYHPPPPQPSENAPSEIARRKLLGDWIGGLAGMGGGRTAEEVGVFWDEGYTGLAMEKVKIDSNSGSAKVGTKGLWRLA